MNQNSNIRRIDELGRLVIPKDIRKKLHIKDNEPLEIYVYNDEIKIKKYSALPDIQEYIKFLIDISNRITHRNYIVVDRNAIVASNNKNLEGLEISNELEETVLEKKEISKEKITIPIADENKITAYFNIEPIIIENTRSGAIIEYSDSSLDNNYIAKLIAQVIEKALNNY